MFLALACAAPEPWWPPEDAVVAASVTVSGTSTGDEPGYVATVSTSGGVQEVQWDHCTVTSEDPGGIGGFGGAGPVPDLGSEWLWVDGDRVPLDFTVDLDPFTGWLGAGWSGGQDRQPFDRVEALQVPDPIDLQEPELDGSDPVSVGDGLVVRWKGSSDGRIGIFLNSGERRASCYAIDDGRFDVPGAQLGDLRGEVALTVSRTAIALYPYQDPSFALFQWTDHLSGTVQLAD